VVLVTGSASFLGRAICRKFNAEGFDLALHYGNSQKPTLELARDLARTGASVTVFKADLSKEKEAKALVPRVLKVFGRLDVLVNNASLFLPDAPKSSYRAQDDLFSVNLFAPCFLIDRAAPYLKRTRGSVVNLADIYGENPILKGYKTYCATKAALINATRSFAGELGPKVRVNAISPGAFFVPKNYDRKRIETLVAKSALKRKGEPNELADAVYFMASHPFITGQVLKVDGGRFLI
jgi:pteridine reductase